MAESVWTATEWTALGAVLSGTGTVIGALAVLGAAWFARNTFEGWRRQRLSERYIEQAERILTAAYKARRALGHVRNPLIFAHELHTAEDYLMKQDDWVKCSRKRKLITAQAYYNRLNSILDERRAVDECLPMARALFGEHVEQALELLNRQFQLVSIAVDMNGDDGHDRDFARTIREDLSSSSGSDRPNKMNAVIEEQVNLIEHALVPVLRLEAK